MPYAIGIKDQKNLGSFRTVNPGDMLEIVRQLHDAKKAGKHFDVRIGNKNLGLLSWATRKEMPGKGESIQLFRQPVHSYSYKNFEGVIPFGYGAGRVKKVDEGKVLITRKTPSHISFTIAHEQIPKRFGLINADTKNALLVRAKDPVAPGVVKPKFKNIPTGKLKVYVQGIGKDDLVQPKIDGALTLFHLSNDRDIEALSHRTSKRTGGPIYHTERFFGHRPKLTKLPDKYKNTVLLGEMYGERHGQAIAPQTLGGILNSTIATSLKRQNDEGVKLKTMLFDVPQLRGKSTEDMPYEQRLAELKKIVKFLPGNAIFQLPETVKGPKAGGSLLKRIQSGRHPLTAEGVIVRKKDGESSKAKLFKEHDVYIREIFEGTGKYKDKAAGGFWYSLTPDGEPVGKVGTGLSDQMRTDLWKNPQTYLGRVARISAQGQFPDSGAYRAPALIAVHESK